MKTTRILVLAALLLTSLRQVEAQQPVDAWMEQRVSLSYQNAQAIEVLGNLSRLNPGPSFSVTPGPFHPDMRALLPVTIMLNNVKLRTALDAVCQTAQCEWDLRPGNIIHVSRVVPPVTSAPETISVILNQASLEAVSRAVAAALNLSLVAEVQFPDTRSNWNIENGKVAGMLRLLSEICGCEYAIDEAARVLRVKAVPGAVPRVFQWRR